MQRKDWTLLAICAANGQGLSPVQLQKVMFVLGKEMTRTVGRDYYKFEPYHYGPFDADVYNDAEELSDEGLVTISRPIGQNYNQYIATAAGCDRAAALAATVDQHAIQYLNRLVEWTLRQSFSQLVSAIYSRWPAMKANSVFQE